MAFALQSFFDPDTFTVSYVIAEQNGSHCVIIDSVLDYDPKSGRTSTKSADKVITYIKDHGLTVDWILETHVHADHLSASQYLKNTVGGQIALGEHVVTVQKAFKGLFNAEESFSTDGSQFDKLLCDGDCLQAGTLEIKTLHTPGHTPACVTYQIEDALFVGDTLFMPDFGTARCDFPGGDAHSLYRSIQKILSFPDETRIFLCHDYAPGGRSYLWETTVGEQKTKNIHVNETIDEDAFVALRQERDAALDMPVLILPSVQINMRAGAFPPADDNGVAYLKIPLDAL